MPLKPGSNRTTTDFANSMAAAMEQAFNEEWPFVMKDAAAPPSSAQMKLLFAAIAKGVVRHLHSNPTSFEVTVSNGIDTHTGTVTRINKTE